MLTGYLVTECQQNIMKYELTLLYPAIEMILGCMYITMIIDHYILRIFH